MKETEGVNEKLKVHTQMMWTKEILFRNAACFLSDYGKS